MLDVDENRFRKWLGLTQQQYDIIRIIYKLKNRGLKATPKDIQKEYRIEQNKYLMKPNLFNILRILQMKKIILRKSTADYALDIDGMKGVMAKTREELQSEVEDFEKTRNQVEQYFKEITYRREVPDIQYLEGKELYVAMADSLERSDTFYVVADFPMVAYSREITQTMESEPYVEMLWKRLKEKKGRVCYLTDLNMDALFNHTFRTFGDFKTAYRECQTALDRLQTKVETHKNLDIRYTDAPHGLDVAIVEQNDPIEFIMFTRDEHDHIHGGIRIKSHKTASNALKAFQRNYEYATPLNTPAGIQLIQKTKQGMKEKYKILGE